MIKIKYQSIDRFSKTATFKTVAGAQRFAHKWVGETPEISLTFGYAVSADGVGKVTWAGTTAQELFPKASQ